ncbi:MAG TPA: carbon-nitrogen hydrolase family protein [Paralcaligenes sp.]
MNRESENRYPKIKVAAVQAGPVFMDRDETVDKACRLIQEAGSNGAQLVAFPEAFIPAYPYWSRYLPPMQSMRYTKELIKQAVQVGSPTTERLTRAARDAGIHVVIGINEKVAHAHGTLFNTNLLIGPTGQILGRHRKLVPTLSEKLVWAYGDGEGLQTHETELGRLGSLICGENANPLARYVLIADGEQVHVANYLALPKKDTGGYNLAKDIEIRSAAHSFEGKIFTVVSSLVINQSVIDYFSGQDELQALLSSGSVGHTAVYGPWGLPVAGPMEAGIEGILYADIDLEDALLPKLRHDIGGGYNRFDIMRVLVNRNPHRSLQDSMGAARQSEQAASDGVASKPEPRQAEN